MTAAGNHRTRRALLSRICPLPLAATARCCTSASNLRRGASSTRYIADITSAPPISIRQVTLSDPNSTANADANTGSIVIAIAARVGVRCACAQVWTISASAPAISAM